MQKLLVSKSMQTPASIMSSSQRIHAALECGPLVYTRSELETLFLPIEQMLQIDRVCEIWGDQIICEMDIPGHWVFPMHFPLDPIFPGSLLIEAAGQAAAIWAWHVGLRGRPRLVKVTATFQSPVLPHNQTVTLKAKVRRRKNICIGEVKLSVKERQVAEITPIIVVIPE